MTDWNDLLGVYVEYTRPARGETFHVVLCLNVSRAVRVFSVSHDVAVVICVAVEVAGDTEYTIHSRGNRAAEVQNARRLLCKCTRTHRSHGKASCFSLYSSHGTGFFLVGWAMCGADQE